MEGIFPPFELVYRRVRFRKRGYGFGRKLQGFMGHFFIVIV
jgi:hypothetical protein